MTPDRYDQIRKVFLAARDLASKDRGCYLDESCGNDADLRARVERLLAEEKVGTQFLAEPVVAIDVAASATPATADAAPCPQQIGRYRILRQIGIGGMGVVFEAEQERPRRTVALKVINPGVLSAALLRRFEYEAEVLGRLQHPGIAQIYEADKFDSGRGVQPFFAMELVQGEPLIEYVYHRKLGTRERLELFSRICDAVHHAHQRGVIHRDLKPANILVTPDGQPKILDFGVARATDADLQTTTLRTDVGKLIGTVPYMSPEQAAGDPAGLDTRSDVYALGVIAYEMLSGQLPYDVREKLVHEAVRVIREDEPTPLSSINRVYRGDLDTIVTKALEKDKTRRFESASALAAQVRLYLDGQPLTIGRRGALYHLGKFTRRHRALVTGAAAVFVALVAGVIASTVFAVGEARAREAADIARTEAERREAQIAQIAEFQGAILQDMNPVEMGRTIVLELRQQVRAGLDRTWVEGDDGAMRKPMVGEVEAAVARFDEAVAPANATDVARNMMQLTVLTPAVSAANREFAEQPEVRARLLDTIGTIYRSLGLYESAEAHLRNALGSRREALGDRHLDVATTLTNLADVVRQSGNHSAAEPLYREALAMCRDLVGSEHEQVAVNLNRLGLVLQAKDDYAGAERLYREALAMRVKLFGEEHRQVATSLNNLALLHWKQGDYAEAEPLYRRSLLITRRVLGDRHPDVATGLINLGVMLRDRGDYAAAEPLLREALDVNRQVHGEEHSMVVTSMNALALLLQRTGEATEAKRLYRDALALCRDHAVGDQWGLDRVLNNLTGALWQLGDYEAAEEAVREALALRRSRYGDEHSRVATSLSNLAEVLKSQGKHDEAEPIQYRVVELDRKLLGGDHPNLATSLNNLAGLLRFQGKHEQAEPLYVEALAILERKLAPNHPNTAGTRYNLGRVLTSLGRFAEAETQLLASYESFSESGLPAGDRLGRVLEALSELYEARHGAEPDQGYDAKAAEWQAKFDTWRTTTQPATE